MNNIDSTTNLPVLPDGFWWNVDKYLLLKSQYLGDVFRLRVSIMCKDAKRTRFRKRVIPGEFVDRRAYSTFKYDWDVFIRSSTPEELILEGAERAYEMLQEDIRVQANSIRIANLLGDYPPKRLEIS